MTARLMPTLCLSLLVMLSACSGADDATPLETEAPAFDVTTEALVTNTIQFKLMCANGVSGRAYYSIGVQFYYTECPGGSRTFTDPGGAIGVGFEALDPAPGYVCSNVNIAGDALPFRYTCTVNGPNWRTNVNPGYDYHGQPLARLVLRYVQDP